MKHPGLPSLSWLRSPTVARLRPLVTVFGLAGAFHLPDRLAGQGLVQDFVISGGLAGEAWRGDFKALTVPQIDSTEHAVAWVGEWSANGIFTLMTREHSTLEATVDAGFRQFATGGYQLRNYAPREHSGLLKTQYRHDLGGGRHGRVIGEATASILGITDRPPMPIYLSPGYETYRLTAGYGRNIRDLDMDLTVSGERADYNAPALLPNLDLLDRTSLIVEAGGGRRNYRGSDSDDYSGFRFFGAYRYHSYPKQGPVLRVDHAIGLGGSYELSSERIYFRTTFDGTRSRSRSDRVEYNAARLNMEIHWGLSETMEVSLSGKLARKRYIHPVEHALVPGEEADNESNVYAEISRRLGPGVDGAFRLGWQKVETNFSGAYYTRFVSGFFLRARPGM